MTYDLFFPDPYQPGTGKKNKDSISTIVIFIQRNILTKKK